MHILTIMPDAGTVHRPSVSLTPSMFANRSLLDQHPHSSCFQIFRSFDRATRRIGVSEGVAAMSTRDVEQSAHNDRTKKS